MIELSTLPGIKNLELSPAAARMRETGRIAAEAAVAAASLTAHQFSEQEQELIGHLQGELATRARLRVLSNGYPVCDVLRGDGLAHEIGMQLVARYLDEHPEIEIASTHVLHEVDALD